MRLSRRKEKYKILFTCRDAGAAHHISALVQEFIRRRYEAVVVASDAAYPVLKKAGLNTHTFSIAGRRGFTKRGGPEGEMRLLLDKARKVLDSVKPSAVFCGLTTIDYGLDEAALYWAHPERMDIPSFQFLDSWGTFNTYRGARPSMYFGMDKDSVRLGCGAGAPISVVGSPKHSSYSSMPVMKIRACARKRLGIRDGEKLVGYFGQLPSVPGHMRNFRELVMALKYYSGAGSVPCRLLVRPHPAYINEYGPYWEYLKREKIAYINGTGCDRVEDLLCSCDIVATCYSTSALDHAYLSSHAKEPVGTVLYLLSGKAIKGYLKRNFGYWRNPLLERGIGISAERKKSMVGILTSLLEDKGLTMDYFRKTKSLYSPDPCGKIVEAVSGIIERRHGK